MSEMLGNNDKCLYLLDKEGITINIDKECNLTLEQANKLASVAKKMINDIKGDNEITININININNVDDSQEVMKGVMKELKMVNTKRGASI